MFNTSWNRGLPPVACALLVSFLGGGCLVPTRSSAPALTPEEQEILARSIERIEQRREAPAAAAEPRREPEVELTRVPPKGQRRPGPQGRTPEPADSEPAPGPAAQAAAPPTEAAPEALAQERPSSPSPSAPGGLRGRITLERSGQDGATGAPVVVMAVPIGRAVEASNGTTVLSRGLTGFDPPFLAVPTGETIRFENHDEICHSFFSSSPNHTFELGMLDPQANATYRVEQPGTLQVYCSLHSGKQVTVFAVPTPHFQVLDETGEYDLGELETGSYRMVVWSDGRVLRKLELEVPSGPPRLFDLHLATIEGSANE